MEDNIEQNNIQLIQTVLYSVRDFLPIPTGSAVCIWDILRPNLHIQNSSATISRESEIFGFFKEYLKFSMCPYRTELTICRRFIFPVG